MRFIKLVVLGIIVSVSNVALGQIGQPVTRSVCPHGEPETMSIGQTTLYMYDTNYCKDNGETANPRCTCDGGPAPYMLIYNEPLDPETDFGCKWDADEKMCVREAPDPSLVILLGKQKAGDALKPKNADSTVHARIVKHFDDLIVKVYDRLLGKERFFQCAFFMVKSGPIEFPYYIASELTCNPETIEPDGDGIIIVNLEDFAYQVQYELYYDFGGGKRKVRKAFNFWIVPASEKECKTTEGTESEKSQKSEIKKKLEKVRTQKKGKSTKSKTSPKKQPKKKK